MSRQPPPARSGRRRPRHSGHPRRRPEAAEGSHMAKKVLIADDEPNIVMSLQFLMEAAGYEVRTVGDGEAALGADAYVTKPFATKDLVAEVKALLGDA